MEYSITDSIDAYILETLIEDIELLKQIMRIITELVYLGIYSRAQKFITFIDKCLHAINKKEIIQKANQHNINELYLKYNECIKLKSIINQSLPQLWCQLAETYQIQSKYTETLKCYQTILTTSCHHAGTLTSYSQFVYEYNKEYIPHAQQLLYEHFTVLCSEFAGLYGEIRPEGRATSTDSGSGGTSIVGGGKESNRDSSTIGRTRRSKRTYTTATSGTDGEDANPLQQNEAERANQQEDDSRAIKRMRGAADLAVAAALPVDDGEVCYDLCIVYCSVCIVCV